MVTPRVFIITTWKVMTFLSKVFLFGFSLYLMNPTSALVPWSVLGSLRHLLCQEHSLCLGDKNPEKQRGISSRMSRAVVEVTKSLPYIVCLLLQQFLEGGLFIPICKCGNCPER